ncbi:RHS repeat-associated core domain-containing protein [Pseudomonas silesiensis]|uniref:RHS repeat-associated core domain-containing protein n=1 Tax=Pseudomonas silesiensis TaxID=1853130 RepID=UPI0034D3F076
MPPNRTILLCRYHYDPLDRLVASTPLTQANTQRFYKKDRMTTEVQGEVRRSIMQHDDQLLAQHEHQIGTVETRLLATDLQRTVLNTLDTVQHNPLAYTAYGHRPPESGLLSLLGFNGERPDSLTGYYLLGNGYRAFNPVLMRFNSPDSWSPFGAGGVNSYAYCSGDPVNRNDPSGHVGKLLWAAMRNNLKFLVGQGEQKTRLVRQSTKFLKQSTANSAVKRTAADAFQSLIKEVPIQKVAPTPRALTLAPPPTRPRINQNSIVNQPMAPVNAAGQLQANPGSSIPTAPTAQNMDLASGVQIAQTIATLASNGLSQAQVLALLRRNVRVIPPTSSAIRAPRAPLRGPQHRQPF